MFFQAGAKTIHVAAQKGFVEVVRTLLQRGEHVDVKTNVSLQSEPLVFPTRCPESSIFSMFQVVFPQHLTPRLAKKTQSERFRALE